MAERRPITIYTIGHSDHPVADLIALLQRYGVTRLVDVRSQPYSRWAPQFNRENLAQALREAGLEYLYMGDTLGGRPADPALYAAPGEQERPNYARLAATTAFQEALARLVAPPQAAAAERVTAVMCSEGDHRHCHRALLLAPALRALGVGVRHILPDGGIAEHVDAPRQLSLL
jgi:uncharacterized protein (DUF488 family)